MTARLVEGETVVAEAPLAFSGEVSVFRGTIVPPSAGRFKLEVTAVQADTENVGHQAVPLEIGPSR